MPMSDGLRSSLRGGTGERCSGVGGGESRGILARRTFHQFVVGASHVSSLSLHRLSDG